MLYPSLRQQEVHVTGSRWQRIFLPFQEKFEKMIANNELIEYAKYVENYYGTPRAYVEKMLDEGKM